MDRDKQPWGIIQCYLEPEEMGLLIQVVVDGWKRGWLMRRWLWLNLWLLPKGGVGRHHVWDPHRIDSANQKPPLNHIPSRVKPLSTLFCLTRFADKDILPNFCPARSIG